MTRHRSVLACVALASVIGIGLPSLAAATADGATEQPAGNEPTDDGDGAGVADPGTGETTTTPPVTTVASGGAPAADPATTTTAAPTTTVAVPPPSTASAPTTTLARVPA